MAGHSHSAPASRARATAPRRNGDGYRDSEMVQCDERLRLHTTDRRWNRRVRSHQRRRARRERDLNEGQKISYDVVADAPASRQRTISSPRDGRSPALLRLRVVGGAGLQHLAHVPPVHADEVDRAVRAVRSEIGKGEDKKTVNGPVTATVARRGAPGKMADDDLVCPPPIPARDQISCCYPDQLSVRRRGT